MLAKAGVSYAVHELNLSALGSHQIEQLSGVLRFHSALDVNGVLQPQASIDVRLGTANEAPFPLSIGQAIYASENIRCKLSWAAQSGIVRVVLIVSADRSKFDLDSTPPILQVVGPLGSSLVNTAVNVTGAATLLSAATSNRKKVNIQNAGAASIWIGGAGVTVANGFRVDPGGVYTTEHSSAEYYGISAGGTEAVRVLEENA